MSVTIYKNMKSKTPNHISVYSALMRIKEGKSQEQIEKIRKGDGDKKDLPAVIFAGEIPKDSKTRKDSDLIKHSGYFVLDFDHVDVEAKKAQLRQDSYIYSCWTSPSGDGVKALVRCPESLERHSDYYNCFCDRYSDLDSTSKNLARLCFESYDPDLYVNRNSAIWDRAINEEIRQDQRNKVSKRRSDSIFRIAVDMIRTSFKGNKHENLRDASILLGGYVGAGRVDEDEAIALLESEIKAKDPDDMKTAKQTIRDGIEYGKSRPLHESKRLEKKAEFIRREDGTYDFMADDEEMDEYEQSFINGTLEMGLTTGIHNLDNHWMFKKNHMVWWGGIDNIGKSFLVWYLAVLAAMLHDWRVVVYSAENRDGAVRRKLKEFYIGKPIGKMNDFERNQADKFFEDHFRVMTSKKMHNTEEFLMKSEIIFDQGWEYDVILIDPYNALDIPNELDYHRHNLKSLNMMRVFKENYAAIWVCDHANSQASRDKDEDGYVKVPWKSGIDGGQLKANKVDDFIMLHRQINNPELKMITQAHVQKIKDKETGGEPTMKDHPVQLTASTDLCGFRCGPFDPVEQYWARMNKQQTLEI